MLFHGCSFDAFLLDMDGTLQNSIEVNRTGLDRVGGETRRRRGQPAGDRSSS